MELTFTTQALYAHYLANDYETMEPALHMLPKQMDDEVARIEPDVVGARGWTA